VTVRLASSKEDAASDRAAASLEGAKDVLSTHVISLFAPYMVRYKR